MSRKVLCSACRKKGKMIAASMINHIKPPEIDPASFNSLNDIEALCTTCYSEKQQEESENVIPSS